MKNNLLVALMATILISTCFTSCSKSDEMKGKAIIGTWELVTESVSWGLKVTTTELMVFNADNTGSMTTYVEGGWGGASSDSYEFTYRFDGSSLSIDADDFSRTTDAFVKSGVLTIEAKVNGETFQREYTKLTKEELAQREEERKQKEEERKKEEEAQKIIEQLIGEWVWSFEQTDSNAGYDFFNDIMIFNEDKTGTYTAEWYLNESLIQVGEADFEFDVEDGLLSLTFEDSVIEYKVSFDGNILVLILTSSDEVFAYTKVE